MTPAISALEAAGWIGTLPNPNSLPAATATNAAAVDGVAQGIQDYRGRRRPPEAQVDHPRALLHRVADGLRHGPIGGAAAYVDRAEK